MIKANSAPATISDVAALAGVSPATVSLVVNGRADQYRIGKETQERVRAAVRQTGYSPNALARNMAMRRPSFVGLVATEGARLDSALLAGLEPLLAAAGYRLLVAVVPPDPEAVRAQINAFLHDGAAGVFCLAGELDIKQADFATDRPIVNLARQTADMLALFSVERQGGRALARRFLDNGHRRIAAIRLADLKPQLAAGFREACEAGGARVKEFKTVADFMAEWRAFSAVCCGSGAVLVRLYLRAAGAGLRIPADLSVVAGEEVEAAASLAPAAVCLARNERERGKLAGEMLLAKLRGETVESRRLDWILSAGASVGPARKITVAAPAPAGAIKNAARKAKLKRGKRGAGGPIVKGAIVTPIAEPVAKPGAGSAAAEMTRPVETQPAEKREIEAEVRQETEPDAPTKVEPAIESVPAPESPQAPAAEGVAEKEVAQTTTEEQAVSAPADQSAPLNSPSPGT